MLDYVCVIYFRIILLLLYILYYGVHVVVLVRNASKSSKSASSAKQRGSEWDHKQTEEIGLQVTYLLYAVCVLCSFLDTVWYLLLLLHTHWAKLIHPSAA